MERGFRLCKKRSFYEAAGFLIFVSALSSLPAVRPGLSLPPYYRGGILLCNGLTCAVSWLCFRKMFQDRLAGALCAALYTLSVYRLYAMYGRMAMGEAVCMLFLPLTVCGVYGIYEKQDVKQRLIYYGMMIAGMTGALHAHMPSGVLAGFFLAALFLGCWRRMLRGKRFLGILCSVVVTLLLNARLLGAGFSKLWRAVNGMEEAPYGRIQDKGLYPAQIFLTFFEKGSSRNLRENGLVDVEAIGIGMALLMPLCLFVFLWWAEAKKKPDPASVRMGTLPMGIFPMGKAGAVLGIAALMMSLSLFPWNAVQSLHKYVGCAVYMLQSPEIFLLIATVALTVVAGSAAVWVKAAAGRYSYLGCIACDMLIAAGTAVFYFNSLMTGLQGGR